MLNLVDPLFICPSLFPLMSLVTGIWGHWPVVGRMRVVHPYVRMSSLELSCVLADLSERISPVRGCSSGSVFTLWHTSVSRLAVRSMISLCQRGPIPPQAHISVCSTSTRSRQQYQRYSAQPLRKIAWVVLFMRVLPLFLASKSLWKCGDLVRSYRSR